MRKIKKILSIVFVLAIMASVCIIPASAATGENTAEPMGETCSCGGLIVATSRTTWTSWQTLTTVTCAHGTGGFDDNQRRVGVNIYKKCNGCGKQWKKTVYQYRTLCNGVVVG